MSGVTMAAMHVAVRVPVVSMAGLPNAGVIVVPVTVGLRSHGSYSTRFA